jgi:hypothetical protein
MAMALPMEPGVALIVAMDGVDELHVTDVVRSVVVVSEYIPMAVNCTCVSMETLGFAGDIESDASVDGPETGPATEPPPLPLHPEISAMTRKKSDILVDIIDTYPWWD